MLWSEAGGDVVALSKRLDAPVMFSTGRDDVTPQSYPLYLGTIGRGALPEARAALKALLRSIKRKGVSRPGWLRKSAKVRTAQAAHRNKAAGYNGRPIDPRRAHAALRKVLPRDAIITIDAGVGPGYVYEYQTFERPRSLLAPQGLAAIGIGYPVGLGAKLAASKRPVVAVSGDGSFLYNGAELETAVREGIPSTCIILNNFNYGSERACQEFYYDERYIGDAIGNPPFDEYARLFGAAGLLVTEASDLEDTFAEEALRLGRNQPVLVDVLCSPDVFLEPRRKETVKAQRLR